MASVEHKVICGDFREVLRKNPPPPGEWDTLFMDPPDGINLNYATFDDKFEDYAAYMEDVLTTAICHAKTVWMAFNSIWLPVVGAVSHALLKRYVELKFKPCVWAFTFGQHNKHDLGRNHRPVWRWQWPDAPLYPDDIRVTSARQLAGDKRADPRGRVPGDVFEFPRVNGNCHERRSWHPTQIPEGLVERCLKLTTPPGGTVIDPYMGTGTTLRVCKRLGYSCVTIDVDPGYCEKVREENGL